LAKLCRPGAEAVPQPVGTRVEDCYAHFAVTLERTMKEEVGAERHTACLAAACAPFGISPSKDTQKIPEVVYQMMSAARDDGAEFATLKSMVEAIWLHILGELARAIIDSPDNIESALSAYQDALFPRSREVARMSAQNLKLFFGRTAPDGVVGLFSRLAAPAAWPDTSS
jgi:hypothetical protein